VGHLKIKQECKSANGRVLEGQRSASEYTSKCECERMISSVSESKGDMSSSMKDTKNSVSGGRV
jgi:hypothetical protein